MRVLFSTNQSTESRRRKVQLLQSSKWIPEGSCRASRQAGCGVHLPRRASAHHPRLAHLTRALLPSVYSTPSHAAAAPSPNKLDRYLISSFLPSLFSLFPLVRCKTFHLRFYPPPLILPPSLILPHIAPSASRRFKRPHFLQLETRWTARGGWFRRHRPSRATILPLLPPLLPRLATHRRSCEGSRRGRTFEWWKSPTPALPRPTVMGG